MRAMIVLLAFFFFFGSTIANSPPASAAAFPRSHHHSPSARTAAPVFLLRITTTGTAFKAKCSWRGGGGDAKKKGQKGHGEGVLGEGGRRGMVSFFSLIVFVVGSVISRGREECHDGGGGGSRCWGGGCYGGRAGRD